MTAVVAAHAGDTAPSPASAATTWLRCEDGTSIDLDVEGWCAEADAVEQRLLARVRGPVLDIGCGPGRLVVALASRGVPALGVDASPEAVGQAWERRATALVRSVFDPLPGTGRWATALLLDGNVGIGGDPQRLLARVGELLAPHGRAVIEVEAPGIPTARFRARVERGGHLSAWFPWARVGADHLPTLASRSGLELRELNQDGGRWFAEVSPEVRS